MKTATIQQQRSSTGKRTGTGSMWVPLLLLLALSILVSACTTPISAQMTLLSTAAAMSQVKTAHLDMTLQLGTHVMVPTAQGVPQDIGMTVTGVGDVALQDQLAHLHVTVTPTVGVPSATVSRVPATLVSLPSLSVEQIQVKQSLYLQVPAGSGPWVSVVPPSTAPTHSQGTPSGGQDLTTVLQKVTLVDHGVEQVPGQNVRLHHMTLACDLATLALLLKNLPGTATGPIGTTVGLLQRGAISNSVTVDLWLDDASHLIGQLDLHGQFQEDLKKLGVSLPQQPTSATVTLVSSIRLSKFNEAVNIKAPLHSFPITLPLLNG